MSITFGQAFGGGNAAAAGGWSMPILASKTITFTEAGTAVISVVGAGGAGAAAANTPATVATGGNSAPWGRKKIRVSAGDVLTLTLAAGVLSPATNSTDGASGGVTTIAFNGSTLMTVQGGEGGKQATSTTANAAAATATVTGADYWVPGVRAGSATPGATGSVVSGGAAVDLLSTGLGSSPNRTTYNTSLGGSLGTDSGGIPLPWLVLSDWGITVADPNTATNTIGAPGRGGSQNPALMAGAFAGGGAQSAGSAAGFGAGGAASSIGSGNRLLSGSAYAFLTFTPSE